VGGWGGGLGGGGWAGGRGGEGGGRGRAGGLGAGEGAGRGPHVYHWHRESPGCASLVWVLWERAFRSGSHVDFHYPCTQKSPTTPQDEGTQHQNPCYQTSPGITSIPPPPLGLPLLLGTPGATKSLFHSSSPSSSPSPQEFPPLTPLSELTATPTATATHCACTDSSTSTCTCTGTGTGTPLRVYQGRPCELRDLRGRRTEGVPQGTAPSLAG